MLQNRTPTFQEKTTQLAAAGATVALTPLLVNAVLLIPLNTAGAGALNSFLYAGEISDAPTAAVAIAANDKCYWDNAASVFTNVVGANTRCGNFLEAVAGPAASGLIAFNAFQV